MIEGRPKGEDLELEKTRQRLAYLMRSRIYIGESNVAVASALLDQFPKPLDAAYVRSHKIEGDFSLVALVPYPHTVSDIVDYVEDYDYENGSGRACVNSYNNRGVILDAPFGVGLKFSVDSRQCVMGVISFSISPDGKVLFIQQLQGGDTNEEMLQSLRKILYKVDYRGALEESVLNLARSLHVTFVGMRKSEYSRWATVRVRDRETGQRIPHGTYDLWAHQRGYTDELPEDHFPKVFRYKPIA